MTIGEHIAGEVQVYDYTNHVWAKIADLSDANVISASTRRQCCADRAFEIGGVYAGTMSLVCRLPGLTRYQVKGARVLLRRWYDGETVTAGNEPMEGVFWVTDAKKTAEIFQLTGQDAMLWADVSSYSLTGGDQTAGLSAGIWGFGEFLGQLYSVGMVLQAWMARCTELADVLARRQTGILQSLLQWQDYRKADNGGVEYCNNYLWSYSGQDVHETTDTAYFYLYTADGVYKDDNPRSFLRWLAQGAGGFITVTRDGYLTLRQFVQPSLGDAVVRMADMELDGCEVADFRLQLYNTAVIYDDTPAAIAGGGVPYGRDSSGDGLTPYRICVEGNPFVNGFLGYQADRAAHFLSPVYGLAASMYHYGNDRNCIARPFQIKCHTTDRYELGQRICFPDWHEFGTAGGSQVYRTNGGGVYRSASGIYRLRGAAPLYSVITGMQWTFRGGYVLSCGGEDARVMADCVRATKADRAIRELRSRFKA